ncbi:MAG: TonB-dependent receptor [Gammaproteobacteria bacterium]|nr:TonB-dependent receptor [Gammaproteobacteria bacterium]
MKLSSSSLQKNSLIESAGDMINLKAIKGGYMKKLSILTAALGGLSAFSPVSNAALEEVIVTAQKRVESIQDVPIAIQAISGEDLEALGVSDAQDILKIFSNVSTNASNAINTGFTIRGVGTNNFHGNVNRAVGIYQDEVSMSTPYSGVLGVYDMERVEVLRGPQNTLFGRNTTGGAVNYVSNTPAVGDGLNGFLRGTYGRFEQFDVDGALGFDMGNTAAARFSFQTVSRDGVFENLAPGHEGEELGERDRQSARFQVSWNPSDLTDVLFNVHWAENGGKGVGNKVYGNRDPSDPTQLCDLAEMARGADYETRINCVDSNGFNPSNDDWEDIYDVSSKTQDVEIMGGFVKISHDFGSLTLTSITAYEETEVQFSEDIGGSGVVRFMPHQDSTFDQFTQEFRIASPVDNDLRWIVGLYYFNEDMVQSTNVRRVRIANGAPVTAYNILDQEDEDMSIYGQMEYDLSDEFTLTLGLRYTDNTKEADSLFGVVLTPVPVFPGDTFISEALVTELTGSSPGQCPPPVGGVPCTLSLPGLDAPLEEPGGKIGLDWKFSDAAMLYASYSRGFKAGGFDTRALAAFAGTADSPVDPEFLDAYEIGIKSELADNTVQLNAAFFYYEWEDLQTFAVIDSIPGFFNVPESELMGLEVELKWSPIDSLYVQTSLGWLDTEIIDNGGLAGIDEGHELTNSPEWTFNALIVKDFIFDLGTLSLQSDFRWVDEQNNGLSFADDPFQRKDTQFYINARAAFLFGGEEQYEVALWGDNLTEEKFCTQIEPLDSFFEIGPDPLTSTASCNPSTGQRTYGITAKIIF